MLIENAALAAVLAAAGFTGGVVEFLARITMYEGDLRYREMALHKGVFWRFLIVSGLVGIGGSFAFFAFLGATTSTNLVESYLVAPVFTFSIGLVAGYAARTLLRSMATELERRLAHESQVNEEQTESLLKQQSTLNEQSEKLLQQQRALNELEEKYRIAMNMSILSETLALGAAAQDETKERGIAAGQEILRIIPDNRIACVWLGRIHGDVGDAEPEGLDKAITVCSQFVDNKVRHGQRDKDYADVLFNRACYRLRKWRKLDAQPSRERERGQEYLAALDDLKESISACAGNKEAALEDEDFAGVLDDPPFKKLLQ